jgi:hypothetical protein
MIAATTCNVRILRGCKYASPSIALESYNVCQKVNHIEVKQNEIALHIMKEDGKLRIWGHLHEHIYDLSIVYINTAITLTNMIRYTCHPVWLLMMTITKLVLHGIWHLHPPSFWYPCIPYKVASVNVAMKVWCVFVLFYLDWQINKNNMYIHAPPKEQMSIICMV